MSYTVYALVCPNTNNVRYIGYTSKSLPVRLKWHYYDINSGIVSHKVNFLKSVLPKKVQIITIEENLATVDDAVEREIFWISQYSNLTNSTSGGEKSKTYRHDVRKKMSDRLKGKMSGTNNPMFGKKRPDLVIRNKTVNPESSKKRGVILTIKYSTPEYKKLHQQTQKNCVRLKSINSNGVEVFYNSAREAGRAGFERKSINQCLSGKHKQHKGLIWKVS